MVQLLLGSIFLSLLHALIPNHWLPVIAIGRKEHWNNHEVTWVTFLCGLAHGLSTIMIGLVVGWVGLKLSYNFAVFTRWIAPGILILLGIYFIYQHHRHHHFHLHRQPDPLLSKGKIIVLLTTTMFFSPCLEIIGYFMMAGTFGFQMILLVAFIYLSVSISGMVLWVRWAFNKTTNLNWHTLEHNAGIITGTTLIITGAISFFVN